MPEQARLGATVRIKALAEARPLLSRIFPRSVNGRLDSSQANLPHRVAIGTHWALGAPPSSNHSPGGGGGGGGGAPKN